jgi:hypothetical protein
MTKPMVYVPGQNADADRLVQVYDLVQRDTLFGEPVAGPERPPEDPLGLKEVRENSGDFANAKLCTEKLVRFAGLLAGEYALANEEQIFLFELFALVTLNAEDCPVPAARVEEIRQAAYAYYCEAKKALASGG